MPATKIALIAGANKGIGLEIARQLGGQGTLPLVGSRDGKGGLTAAAALTAQGLAAAAVTIDVTDDASITTPRARSSSGTVIWIS